MTTRHTMIGFVLTLAVLALLALLTKCSNPIMASWWPDPNESPSPQTSAFHVVRFEANGGTPPPGDQLIAHGERVASIPPVGREHSGFGGWFRDPGFSGWAWDFANDTVNTDLTLHARWEAISYTVTFETNGGTPMPETKALVSGSRIPEPLPMSLAGSGFAGWFRDAGFVSEWNFAADVVTGNTTLYARWDVRNHRVSFDADGGSPAPDTQLVAHGMRLVAPAAMRREHSGFGGWFRDSGLSSEWNFAADIVTADMTLFAKWDTDFHTVRFLANGGLPAPQDLRVIFGAPIPRLPPISRPGFSFGGWYADAGFARAWDFAADTVEGDMELHARWERNISVHSVIFDADGGLPAPEPQSVVEGTRIVEPAPMRKEISPGSNAWFGFGGWFTDRGFTDRWDFAVGTADRSLTLFARWTEAHCSVVFEANGGSPAPAPQDLAHGTRVKEPLAMTRAAHGFAGWFRDAEFTEQWNFASDTVTAAVPNLTLYARWVADTHLVSFVAAPSTSVVTPQSVVSGGRALRPPDPMPPGDGRAFAGWFTHDGSGGNWGRQWDFANDAVTAPVTLYARWVYQTRTVVFQVNGGLLPNGTEMRTHFTISANGGIIVNPATLVREGHSFGGWFTDLGFSRRWDFETDRVTEPDEAPGTDPMYLYAMWVANVYAVTFEVNSALAEAPPRQDVAHGERVERPRVAAAGKVLAGWYSDPGLTAEWNFDADTVRSALVLRARWEDAVYSVGFNLRLPAGNAAHPQPEAQNVTHNGRVLEPFMPALAPDDRTSMGFLRWDFSQDGSGDPATLAPWDFSTAVTGDMTLHARWVRQVPGMVWVPRGSFVMGDSGVSGSPAAMHSYPTRRVTLDGFFIGRNLVTQAQFEGAMAGNPFGISARPSQFQAGQPERPVERVSWYDAVAFANAFSDAAGLERVFSVSGWETAGAQGVTNITRAFVNADWSRNGFRLPTEAEWEFAARGGNGAPEPGAFAGSSDADAVAWFYSNSGSQTHAVGTKGANLLGIFDMNGNVSEWCWDAFASYRDIIAAHPMSEAHENPRGPDGGTERVRRGGSWNNAVGNVRTVVRNSAPSASANWVIGFRLARSPGAADVY